MADRFTEEIIALKNPEEKQRIRRQQLFRITQEYLRQTIGITLNIVGILAIFFGGRATNNPHWTLWGIITALGGITIITLGTNILLRGNE